MVKPVNMKGIIWTFHTQKLIVYLTTVLSQLFRRLCHLYSTNPDRTPYLQHALLLPMSSQYTISTAHIQSEHHLSWLYMSSQYTISPVHVQSVHHLFCPSPLKTLPCLSMSYQYISPALVQSECHLRLSPGSSRIPSFLHLYPCTVSTSPFLSMSNQSPYLLPVSSQFITSPTHMHL